MLEVKSNSVLSIKVSTAPENECVKLKPALSGRILRVFSVALETNSSCVVT